MKLADVQRIREMAGENNIIRIFCDNVLTFFAGPVDGYEFIWDDDNNCAYQLRPNTSTFTQDVSPIEITIIPYEHIQYMYIQTDLKETIEFLKARRYDEQKINKVIENLKVFSKSKPSKIITSDKQAEYLNPNNQQ